MEVSQAKAALGFFPDSRVRGILMDIADFTLSRTS
jgi:hypothetical protein